ncbi:serine protease [Streptococcus pneumoniae]|nr:serine protease [Streptococcus pneumoniae]
MLAPLLLMKMERLKKNLEVTYAGEGQGRNRKLDKDGNTIYEIKGAGDLRGKIIEVIALDGSSNFTKIHRIKFADQADEKGMISYYLVDPDKDASKYEKLGEISEDKLKNAKSPEENTNNNQAKDEDSKPDEKSSVEGEASLEINKTISTIREFENKDLKKLIKKKFREVDDFTSETGKRIEEYDYKYDDKRNIIAYDDGSALQYETEKFDEIKSKIYGVLSPSKDGHFEILGKISNVSKNAKVYYGNSYKSIEIKATKYDSHSKTMIFDLYANINDIVDGLAFAGDMRLFVKDDNQIKAETKIRMPEKNKETKAEYPYVSSYGNVIELGEGDLSKNKPDNLTKMESGKIYSDSEKQQYLLKDNIILRKGYALKVTTYNPGKTDMLEGNGVYSKEDIAKIQKANPNLRVLSETTIYADSRNVEDGRSTQAVLMSALDGFNIIRYQVFTFKMNDKGEAIDKDGNLVTDSSKLVLFGKDDKEYTGEDKSNVEAIKEDGSMLFIDTKPVNLSMDKNYFNPSKSNKIYVRNPEFYLRGKISDKGGFNWELRVNESVVDNYLIYGDLHIDNTRDFNIKLNVKDGDIMDWGMKDYKANGFPDKVTDMDGNVYLQTGYSDLNAKAVGVHYQFLYDNVKPEVNIDPKGNTSIEYADGKSVVFNINDKRNNGFDGEIQEQHIYVNGKEYTSFDDIKQITDKTLNIKIVVKDFARNTTVKEFILNKDTGEVSELKPHRVTVTIQNGKEMSSTIVSEEDFILPVYKGELEKGYQFDGWEISGFEGKKDAGYVINLSKDTFIKPVFKKIEEKKEEENKPTFDVSKKKDNPQVNHSQLNESHRKEDLQREDHSQKSDSTKDVTATVLDKNNISSKSTTNNPNKLPKTGTASGAQTLLAAGIMFIVGIFLGLKKKNQD